MTLHRNLTALALFLTLAAALAFPPAARADGTQDVLQLIPDDAWGFVIVRSLDTLDNKAKVLQDIFGPTIPAPITPMALGMLNLGDTLDMSRPLAIVMMDAQKLGGPDKAGVALIPAKDPKALLAKIAAPAAAGDEGKEKKEKKPSADKPKSKKTDKEGDDEDEGDKKGGNDEPLPEGITKCAIMGQPSFAAINEKAKIVILGSSQDTVLKVSKAKKTLGEGFDKTRAVALGKADIYVSISLSKVLAAYKDMVMPLLQMATAASDPSGKGAQNLIKMCEESTAIDIALNLDKEGVSLVVLILPEKESDLEKLMKDNKNSTEPLLKVLPKEKFLFAAGGTAAYSEHAEKFTGGVGMMDMLKKTGLAGLDEKAVKQIDEGMKKLGKICDAWAFSASALPTGAEGMVGLTIVIETKNPADFMSEFRKIYKTVWEVSEDEDFAKVKKSLVHTPDAETVGDNKIDTIVVKLDGLAEMGDLEEDELAQIEKIVGKDITLRLGPAGSKHVVLAFGGGKQRFQSICEGLKSGPGLSADSGIKAMGGRLPSARASEAYIAVDNILQFAKELAKAMGEEKEVPFEVPTIDAPFAFSSSQVGSVQQMDFVVPMKLITAVKDVIAQQMKAGADAFEEEDEEGEGKDEAEEDEGKDEDKDDEESEEDEGDEGKDKDEEEEDE